MGWITKILGGALLKAAIRKLGAALLATLAAMLTERAFQKFADWLVIEVLNRLVKLTTNTWDDEAVAFFTAELEARRKEQAGGGGA